MPQAWASSTAGGTSKYVWQDSAAELTYMLEGDDFNGHSVLLTSSMKCSRERIRSFSTRVQPSDNVFKPACHVKDA